MYVVRAALAAIPELEGLNRTPRVKSFGSKRGHRRNRNTCNHPLSRHAYLSTRTHSCTAGGACHAAQAIAQDQHNPQLPGGQVRRALARPAPGRGSFSLPGPPERRCRGPAHSKRQAAVVSDRLWCCSLRVGFALMTAWPYTSRSPVHTVEVNDRRRSCVLLADFSLSSFFGLRTANCKHSKRTSRHKRKCTPARWRSWPPASTNPVCVIDRSTARVFVVWLAWRMRSSVGMRLPYQSSWIHDSWGEYLPLALTCSTDSLECASHCDQAQSDTR